MSKHLTYLYPSPGSAGGLILWKGSSHGHKVLAQRGPSDCWVFHCIIAGSWPYNVKHVEVTAQYKLNWYVFANRDPPAKGFQRTQTSSHPVFKDSNCTLLRVDDAVHRLSADWNRKERAAELGDVQYRQKYRQWLQWALLIVINAQFDFSF